MLQNPDLKGFPKEPLEFDNHGSRGFIEWPDSWEWVDRHKEGFPSPESYHREDGYEISAGSREWESGFKQSVDVEAGHYYRLMARFTPEMYRYDPNPIVPYYFEWHFEVRGDKLEVDSPWTSVPPEALHKKQDHELIFRAPRDTRAEITFIGRGTAWDYIYKLRLHRLEMISTDKPTSQRSQPILPAAQSLTGLTEEGWQAVVVKPVRGHEFANIRIAPSTQAEPPVGRIAGSMLVEVAPGALVSDPDGTPYRWIPVRSGAMRGWVREDAVDFTRAAAEAVQARAAHRVEFTFYGTPDELAAVQAAIAKSPQGFSDVAAQFARS
jgi:hypothetical protein